MPGNPHTSVRSRTVATELRRLREERGLSCVEAAEVIGGSPSKISRIETGCTGMQVEDVAALLGFYQVTMTKRAELLELLRRGEQKGWWERQAGLPRLWRTLIDLENKATGMCNYEPMVIPGLLQTAEYGRTIIRRTGPNLGEAELDNLIASRMARQTVLTSSRAPRFIGIIHEFALRIPVGEPGVMARQLRHLLGLAERPNVTLHVVPIQAGAHAGLRGSFMIMEFADEPGLIHIENQDTGLFLDEAADLAKYHEAQRDILNVSLTPAATAQLIETIADEASRTGDHA